MRRLRRWLFLALPLLLLGPAGWTAYRHVRQARLDAEVVAAVNADDLARVGSLLNQGGDPNARPQAPRRPGWRGYLDVLLGRKRAEGEPARALAAENERWRAAEVLVRHGANPNVRDKDGNTPLIAAAEFGSEADVALLLAHGADARRAHLAVVDAVWGGEIGNVKELLAAGADPTRRLPIQLTSGPYSASDLADDPALRRLLGRAEADWRRRHPAGGPPR